MSAAPPEAEDWLERAHQALVNASSPRAGGGYEDPAYLAQQAAERALKALLITDGVADFPHTHSIGMLLDLLEKRGRDVPPPVRDAAVLTEFATFRRYPPGAVTEGEYESAFGLAGAVVEWVDEQFRDDG